MVWQSQEEESCLNRVEDSTVFKIRNCRKKRHFQVSSGIKLVFLMKCFLMKCFFNEVFFNEVFLIKSLFENSIKVFSYFCTPSC